ncbi:hypothetical protein [Pseudobacter ginsenosidimutans]|uniref:HTH cro/C1-type domain-containing protein n=1 Tax=Pseudobacter ginsenosidimutans TaxID=661488 RepID=A0A4Q7MUM0_9BACT|nr:hypothetical protein [Pseudobacter ginsenosidimutans]QEC41557.1 hypothetical protein FSB84_07535 [Pseudobacter ginsenosidimutans]RZS71659.1 hypothetical protein EV199_3567 [Pseudobacter ginsenosidimutans]
MEEKEKDLIKLKAALVFKKIIDNNKGIAEKLKEQNAINPDLITSYRKWETASGVPIASISEIMTGERNASLTTLVTLINSLGINTQTFGQAFDNITESELRDFKKELNRKISDKGKTKK